MDEIKKMTIADIIPSDTLTVLATLGKKKVELPVEYAVLSEAEKTALDEKYGSRVVPLENILTRLQEKVVEISFKGNISKLELLVVNSNGVFHWDNVKVYKTKTSEGKDIHIIFSSREEGEKYNRRRGVRIPLDERMEIEQDGDKFPVVVRDISYCGMSFIEPDGKEVEPGTIFTLYLTEKDEEGEKLIGTFDAKILNKRTIKTGQVICGCVISAEYAAMLQKFVIIKQMEKVRGRKSQKIITKVKTGEYWKDDLAEELNESIT